MSAPRTLANVALVDLATRARIVRELCRATGDVDERFAFVELAFLTPPANPTCVADFREEPDGQLALDLEAVEP